METVPPSCQASHEHPSGCTQPCGQSCPQHPGTVLEPIVLAEALERFDREAKHGVCDTGRYRMPYFSWGEGPPLVFIHGLGDSSRSFLQPMSRLARQFRCISYDHPTGHRDGARLRRYTHAHFVEDLWALMDHLGLPQAYLLGSSFGSMIVLAAMHARPERVPRAILQGGLARRPLRRAELFLAHLARFLPGTARRIPYRTKVLRATQYRHFEARSPEVWDYFLKVTARARLSAFGHVALMVHQLDLRPLLPAIRQPVLLVCGDGDRIVPPFFADVLQEGLPNARRAVIENCGHMPSYTSPEVFAEIIRQFLTPPAPQRA
jgi:pimeloyl-ACP methyl ester carboxylesterase